MQTLGVPYEVNYANQANNDLETQAATIAESLLKDKSVVQIMKIEGVKELNHSQIVALIAYLQRIGTDIKTTPESSHPTH